MRCLRGSIVQALQELSPIATVDFMERLQERDPGAFVAEAERLTNSHDAEGASANYAPGAVLELVTDGALERHVGPAAIREAWRVVLHAGRARGFRVRKTLVAVDGDTIVNRWEGEIGGRDRARGIETWRFDADGLIVEHVLFSFLDVRPSTSLVARARIAIGGPRTALTLLREQRKAG